MSDQTILAFAAVIRHAPSSAFWIDTFCIPSEQPQLSATLQSIGFIYNLASEVFACLSRPTFAVLDQMNQSDTLSNRQISVLEQDAWISSVWTYQEVMNSRKLRFVCNQHGDAIVDGLKFLNRLGYSLEKYKKLNRLDDFNMHDQFPHLDSFGGLIGDWEMLAYTEVTALQVISNIGRRSTAEPKNLFFSMLGAITKNPAQLDDDSILAELSESFMNTCQQKNDYSFICSSTMRNERTGKRWRPKIDIFHPILMWQIRDTRNQRGYYDSEGVWLENMIEPSLMKELDFAVRANMLKRLQLSDQIIEDNASIAQKVYYRLQQVGFTGTMRI